MGVGSFRTLSRTKTLVLVVFISTLTIFLGVYVSLMQRDSGKESLTVVSTETCIGQPPGPPSVDCYAKILDFDSPVGFWTTMREVDYMVSSPQHRHFQVVCHEVTHKIGKKAAEVFQDFQHLYKTTPSSACMNGLQHGLLEFELSTMPTDVFASTGRDLCKNKFNHEDRCLHLLAHLAVQRSPVGRLEDRMDLARKICGPDPVYTEPEMVSLNLIYRCFDGAYMEASTQIRRATGETVFNGDPLKFCSSLRETAPIEASACTYQMANILYSSTFSAQSSVDACIAAGLETSRAFSELCLVSVLNYIAIDTEDPVSSSREVCQTLGPRRDDCEAGYARSIKTMLGWDAADEFCEQMRSPADCKVLYRRPVWVEYRTASGIGNIVDYLESLDSKNAYAGEAPSLVD